MHARFPISDGHMTESVRRKFIAYAISKKLMPDVAARMPDVVSLTAPSSNDKPIQFWQLHSILGQKPILAIVTDFYGRIYADTRDSTKWFRSAFSRISNQEHHVQTQYGMWLDCFGGGGYYHGGEYRLNFHHANNAAAVMTGEGGLLWTQFMEAVLDDACSEGGSLFTFCQGDKTQVARIRCAVNTFLGYFLDDYAAKFHFSNTSAKYALPFGARNPPIGVDGKVLLSQAPSSSLLNLTDQQIKAMSVSELRAALVHHKVDISQCVEKEDLVSKALRLIS